MIQKQTGYYKNVYLTKEDYLPKNKQANSGKILGIVAVLFAVLCLIILLISFL